MNICSPETKCIFRNTISLDATDHMLNAYPYLGYCTILYLFLICERAMLWFLFRLFDAYTSDAKSLKTHILIQDTSRRKDIPCVIGQSFVVPLPFIRDTQETNATILLDDQNVLDNMTLFLSTVIQGLFIIVQWPIYWSLTAVMDKRGASFSEAPSSVSAEIGTSSVRSGRQPAHSRASFRIGCKR